MSVGKIASYIFAAVTKSAVASHCTDGLQAANKRALQLCKHLRFSSVVIKLGRLDRETHGRNVLDVGLSKPHCDVRRRI